MQTLIFTLEKNNGELIEPVQVPEMNPKQLTIIGGGDRFCLDFFAPLFDQAKSGKKNI